MAVQYPKWASFTMPERVQLHIYRDPPKAIHTRKKERIGDEVINYNVRADESRISEAVMNYARGINPSVEVDYSGHGAGGSKTHSLSVNQPSNPYKVNKAFRPPMYRQEDLRALSRLRRPYTYGITNPGVRDGFVDTNLSTKIDQQEVDSAVSVVRLGTTYPAYIPPRAIYTIDKPVEMMSKYNISDRVSDAKSSSALTGDEKKHNLHYYDPENARYNGTIAGDEKVGKRGESKSSAISREGFQDWSKYNTDIKTGIREDGTYNPMSSALYDPNFMNNVEDPEYELERTTPLVEVSSAVSEPGITMLEERVYKLNRNGELVEVAAAPSRKGMTMLEDPEYRLDRNGELITVSAAPSEAGTTMIEDPEYKLDRNGDLISVGSTVSNVNRLKNTHSPEYKLETNNPFASYHTTPYKPHSVKNTHNPEYEFGKNIPSHASSSASHQPYFIPKHQEKLATLKVKTNTGSTASNPGMRELAVEGRDGMFDQNVTLTRGGRTGKGDRKYTEIENVGIIPEIRPHMFPLAGLRKKTGIATR